jgi:hypothetical protein
VNEKHHAKNSGEQQNDVSAGKPEVIPSSARTDAVFD